MTDLVVLDDPAKAIALDRMKRRATGLLVVAALVFAAALAFEARYPWLGYVRATAEAAMVGGVADWFAVTALFRQPLGLPIPHTAIIPARKDRIGRSLGGFVQRNFLSRDVVAARLERLRAGELLARWVSRPENARLIAKHVAAGLAGATNVLRDEEVRELIDRNVVGRVRAVRVAPILGNVLALLTEGNRHQELLDHAIILVGRMQKPTLKALDYAIAARHDSIEAVHVNIDDAASHNPESPLLRKSLFVLAEAAARLLPELSKLRQASTAEAEADQLDRALETAREITDAAKERGVTAEDLKAKAKAAKKND